MSEYFKFMGCGFDINKAMKLVKNQEAYPIEIEPFAKMISREDGNLTTLGVAIDKEYAKKTTNTDPIIIATCAYDENDLFCLCIDGNHRVYKAYEVDKEKEIMAYVLTPDQTLKIMVGPLREHLRKYVKKHK